MKFLVTILLFFTALTINAQIAITETLPTFDSNRHKIGNVIKLTGGGIYMSNGTAWVELVASSAAFAADGVTILGDGSPGDEFYNGWANIFSDVAGSIAIENTTGSNIVRYLTASTNYYEGQLKFLRVVGAGTLTLSVEVGETYTINGAASLILYTGETAILQYSSVLNDWTCVGGSLLTKNAATTSNQTFVMVNSGVATNYNQAAYTTIAEWNSGSPLVTNAGFFVTSSTIAWTPTGSYLYDCEAHLRFNPSAADQRIEVAVEINTVEQPVKFYTNTSIDGSDVLYVIVRWQEEDIAFRPFRLKARLNRAVGTATLDAVGTSSFALTRKKVN